MSDSPNHSATVQGLARRAKTHAAMETLDQASVSVATGIEGDARGKLRGRQVTVLAQEAWDAACREVGQALPWTTRRANILVTGLELANTTGKTLRIGDLSLAITGETDPCERMEDQASGLKAALTPDWRGGVTCRVTSDGAIHVGDAVTLD